MVTSLREAICAFCDEEVLLNEAFGLTLFPAGELGAYQQWWVHPACIRTAFAKRALGSGLRSELALPLGLPTFDIDDPSLEWESVYPGDPGEVNSE